MISRRPTKKLRRPRKRRKTVPFECTQRKRRLPAHLRSKLLFSSNLSSGPRSRPNLRFRLPQHTSSLRAQPQLRRTSKALQVRRVSNDPTSKTGSAMTTMSSITRTGNRTAGGTRRRRSSNRDSKRRKLGTGMTSTILRGRITIPTTRGARSSTESIGTGRPACITTS